MEKFYLAVVAISGIIDLLLLIAAGYLTQWQINWKRMIAAVLFGSIYVGVCLYTNHTILSRTPVRIFVLALMGCIAYGFCLTNSRRTALFVLLSLSTGALSSGLETGGFWWMFLSAAALALICVFGFTGTQGREYASVSIPCGSKKVSLTALVDTGNTLRDPISGEPVLIVGADAGASLFGLTHEQLLHPIETMVRHGSFRLIPYRSVGQSNSMLLGKRIEGVCIGNQKKSCVVALAPNKIGGNGFNALLGGMT